MTPELGTLSEAEQFFYEHAGYSYDAANGETPEQGRNRCARDLAAAEAWAAEVGLTFRWEDDWTVGNHGQFFGEAYADGEPETCETCTAWLICETCEEPRIVASLSCIDGADDTYRRVVQADLAFEARH